jgi:hypothetical protein
MSAGLRRASCQSALNVYNIRGCSFVPYFLIFGAGEAKIIIFTDAFSTKMKYNYKAAGSRQQAAGSRQQASGSRHHEAGIRQQ